MKIGSFAKNNKVSIDTIRHYMDLGLILPEKKGGQYDFDDRCKKDLVEIKQYKEMGLALSEIKSFFLYKRLGKLYPNLENSYLKDVVDKNLKTIDKQIVNLEETKKILKKKAQELEKKEENLISKMGIDIKVLDIFCCPECGRELKLFAEKIVDNKVITGKLVCECGEDLIIEDGILNDYSVIEEEVENYNFRLLEYFNTTDMNYLDNINVNLELAYKKINFSDFKKKVVLDLGSGSGFFLRYIYNDLPDDTIYLAVDHDIGRHKFLKYILERTGVNKQVVFICSDFLKIPIKDKSVDIIIDNSGTSNYSFENESFLLNQINKYVKDKAYILGIYILFKNFSLNSDINPKYRKNFLLENIQDSINKLGFVKSFDKISDILEKGGKYESYFKDDEKVYTYTFIGER